MVEIWRSIAGYPEYQVSNLGRVKSLKHKEEWILKPRLINSGYYRVLLSNPFVKGKQILIHRLVAIAFVPNPQNKKSVGHLDGNKLNNCADNLAWFSASDSQLHSIKSGRIVRTVRRSMNVGEKNANFDHTVYTFIHKEKGTFTGNRLDFANRYGLNRKSISNLIKGYARSLHGWIVEK